MFKQSNIQTEKNSIITNRINYLSQWKYSTDGNVEIKFCNRADAAAAVSHHRTTTETQQHMHKYL